MIEDNVLEKSDKEYKLNMGWIKDLENEVSIIKKSYINEKLDSRENNKEIKDRIQEFIIKMSPILSDYIGKDNACIITLSGTGYYYGLNLWKHLQREGRNIKFIEVNKLDLTSGKKIRFNAKDLENRKVLLVDYGIFSGSVYKLLTDTIKPLKNKFKIKDIKFAVDIDLTGLSDFAVTRTSTLNNRRIV
jgi:hypothetical protein